MNKVLSFFVALIYFSTPFESVAIVHGVSVVKLVTILFLVVSLLYYKGIPRVNNNFIKIFLLYSFYALLSSLWSINKTNTFQNSIGTLIPSFVVVLFLFHSINCKVDVDRVFKAYAWGSIFVGLIAIVMFLTGFRFATTHDEARLTVLGQDQNELSFLLSWGIVSIVYLLRNFKYSKVLKTFYIVSLFLLAFTILTTGSRTGFVILIFIAIILAITYFKKKRIILIVPLFLIMFSYFMQYLPDTVSIRLLETSEQITEGNLTGRGIIWELGFKAFKSEGAWIQGVGFKSFRTLMDNHYNLPKAGHNTYLLTLIELGIIGLILYLKMILHLFKRVIYLWKKESVFYILLLVPLLLSMMTLGIESRRWLFLLGILIIRLSQFSKNKIEKYPNQISEKVKIM